MLCGLQEAALVTLTPDAREVVEAARFNSEARFKDDLRMLRIEVGFTLPAERKNNLGLWCNRWKYSRQLGLK